MTLDPEFWKENAENLVFSWRNMKESIGSHPVSASWRRITNKTNPGMYEQDTRVTSPNQKARSNPKEKLVRG
jgi:hypothetical protein